jgi:ankyrin repeat protein
MSLLTLTVEILLLIANFLSFKKALTRNNFKKDLNALTLTCEHLHTLPTPTLYRTHGSHALHWACEHNAPKTVKLCLAHTGKTYLNTPISTHKAHIPSSRSVLGSPLCIAVSYKNLGIMRILPNAGADVDFRDYEGRTPLALVIEHAYCYYDIRFW